MQLRFPQDHYSQHGLELSRDAMHNLLLEIFGHISGRYLFRSLSRKHKSKMGFSMLCFTVLLPTTWRRKPQVGDHSLKLSMLPSEILQHISGFLPVSSAVSFVLCSRRFLWLLGDQALHCLRSAGQAPERKLFLTLLEKDISDWSFCHCCTLFHPVAQDDGPEKGWRYFDEPECVRRSGVVHLTMGFRIRYQHAQLLMNHYRFGRAHQMNLERLSHKLTVARGDTTIKTEIWARIVLGELLVRVNSKLRLPSPSDINLIRYRIPGICHHLRGLDQRSFVLQTILCRPCHAGRLPCVECSKRRSCRKCSTWFQLNGRELETPGIEIEINIWRYLGSCETPFDPKWRSQTDSLCSAPKTSTWPGG